MKHHWKEKTSEMVRVQESSQIKKSILKKSITFLYSSND